MTEDEERRAVLEEARSWLGTPYHDLAMVKGAGVDCAMLLKAVYEAVGIEAPIKVDTYSPQWYLHRSDELYMQKVLERAREIPEDAVRPADIVLYKFGRCFAHGAIVVEWPRVIIHAHKQSGMVTLARGDTGMLDDRERRFFTRLKWGA
jgi:NlpC/P60 family putative phage cell wall peptidase